MGLLGVIKFVTRRTIEVLIIVVLLLFLPKIPPEAKYSTSYKLGPSLPFEGALKLNDRLCGAEIWHEGELYGPEAFAEYKGELYTTLHLGDVVKLVGDHIVPVVKFGKPCKGIYEEHICGRPLGLEFDKNGNLYVADAYYGLFKVDVKTGRYERLVATNEQIGGLNVTLPNSVVIASNGDIFWTDSSTEFKLNDGLFDVLADGSGRLIRYDSKTKKNTVLIPNLHFANGVALADDESFVLVSETVRSRIWRYYLTGPKKGSHDVFIDRLPGLTDNLISVGKNGFFVPLVVAADEQNPMLTQVLGPFPLLRKLASRFLGLIQFGFKFANDLYPNELSQRGVHFIGHFSMGSFLYPKRLSILHLSKTGEILDSLHCTDGKVLGISEAFIFKDSLYLGSPFNNYIGRIPLSKIGWEHLKAASATLPPPTTTTPTPTTTTTTKPTTTTPKPTTTTTTPKPTTTTPKPTTTTPKPTTTTPKPTTTTPKPTTTTTTTPKPTTTTPKPTTTTTPKPTTTTPKPTTTTETTTKSPKPAQKVSQAQPVKDQTKNIPVKESQKQPN